MHVECLREIGDLERLSHDWNRLSRCNPLQSWEWTQSWWQGFAEGREPYVLCFRDSGGAVVGLVPLCRSWSLSKGHCLELFGSDKACSDYLSFLVDEMFADDVVAAIVQWLCTADGDLRWDTIDLDGVDLLDPIISQWRKRMAERAFSITQMDHPSCWRLELPPTCPEYLAARSKPRRRLLRKQFSVLQDASSAVHYNIAQSRDQAQEYFELLAVLHQQRWNEAGIQGCFANQRFRTFLHDALDRFWDLGQLHLAIVRADGEAVAASFGIVRDQTHFIYVTGMSPDHAERRPGWLLNAGHLLHAWQHGIRFLDFLRGDEPYKASLGAEPRAQTRLRIAARQPLAQVRYRLWNLGRYCKRFGAAVSRRPPATSSGPLAPVLRGDG